PPQLWRSIRPSRRETQTARGAPAEPARPSPRCESRRYLDHRLDHAGLRFGVARKIADQRIEVRPVRNARRRVDLSGFDQVDGAGEVGGDGVSAGVERLFAAVED